MIGYHYTSKENWEIIKILGLESYLINDNDLSHLFPGGLMGIWLWKSRLEKLDNFVFLMRMVAKKSVTNIVLLEVIYEKKNLLCQGLELSHSTLIENFSVKTSVKPVIILGNIKPQNIRLVREWDLVELTK